MKWDYSAAVQSRASHGKHFHKPQSHQHSLSASCVLFPIMHSQWSPDVCVWAAVSIKHTVNCQRTLPLCCPTPGPHRRCHDWSPSEYKVRQSQMSEATHRHTNAHAHTHTHSVDASRFFRWHSQEDFTKGALGWSRANSSPPTVHTRLSPPCATAATQSPERSSAREAAAVGGLPEFFSTSCWLPTVRKSCEMHRVTT